jgi:hypothetical protein
MIATPALRQLLSNHVLPAPLRASTLAATGGAPLATLLGSDAPAGCTGMLSAVVDGSGYVVMRAGGSSATVLSADVPACLLDGRSFQSVVHLVSEVLLPCGAPAPPARAATAAIMQSSVAAAPAPSIAAVDLRLSNAFDVMRVAGWSALLAAGLAAIMAFVAA